MQKLHYSIVVNAPKEKVWNTMFNDQTFREWTKPFNEGSYYKGNWEEGSKMYFLGPDPESGTEGGMVSRIAQNRPYEYMSIEHLGIMNNGVEDTTSEEAKKWAPAFENYTFNDKDGGTEVVVDMDSAEEIAQEFDTMWPQALERLKSIAEES